MTAQLGLIGAGRMGEALMAGFLRGGLYQPQAVCVSHPQPARRQYWAETYGVRVTPENRDAADSSVLLLAVKPQQFSSVRDALGELPGKDTLLVSVLAGVTLATLEAAFPGRPVIRAMPNTPARVGEACTALAFGHRVGSDQRAWGERLFATVGQVAVVAETQMDAVTALAGSGPAYVAVVVEALIDGGVAAGLPRPLATQLALQTVLGSVKLMQTETLHPAQLKDQVTSPAGTTMAGLAHLEQAGVRGALIQTVLAAYQRSQSLGQATQPR
ncbi:MAG: pyrroline-5-carboxylate reductase [Gloeomargaritaceae cyanobacterium C42_A2020_066]|nr:pyrroline-5-carboxylate reductase [Gloeomargaritaceae cyanobacterium C42_A2020_066]